MTLRTSPVPVALRGPAVPLLWGGAVMATGIVSIAPRSDGLEVASVALRVAGAAIWAGLAVAALAGRARTAGFWPPAGGASCSSGRATTGSPAARWRSPPSRRTP
jgi:hypothetical protein